MLAARQLGRRLFRLVGDEGLLLMFDGSAGKWWRCEVEVEEVEVPVLNDLGNSELRLTA